MTRLFFHVGCIALISALLGCQSKSVCILYPTHQEQVSVLDVSKDVMGAFHKACPDAKLVSVGRELGGRDGRQFIFWVFRFEQDGKLREVLIHGPHDAAPVIYDVQN
ncbi:MAG: hypothetical protein ABUL66_00500 [Verrucomicrobiota bacterium]